MLCLILICFFVRPQRLQKWSYSQERYFPFFQFLLFISFDFISLLFCFYSSPSLPWPSSFVFNSHSCSNGLFAGVEKKKKHWQMSFWCRSRYCLVLMFLYEFKLLTLLTGNFSRFKALACLIHWAGEYKTAWNYFLFSLTNGFGRPWHSHFPQKNIRYQWLLFLVTGNICV